MSVKDAIIDLDDAGQKAMLLGSIRNLSGRHRVSVVKYRARRSDAQNRLYWGQVVSTFADFLRGQGEQYTDEQAHEILRAKFLRVSCINKDTGEVFGERTRSTTELTTAEFSKYIEDCVAWLADMFHVQVSLPGDWN
jgi:hypothetical protein